MEIDKKALFEALANTTVYALYHKYLKPIIDEYNKMVDEYNAMLDQSKEDRKQIKKVSNEIKKVRAENEKLKQENKLYAKFKEELNTTIELASREYLIASNYRLRDQNKNLVKENRRLRGLN